jgi:hypothetical protein
VAENDLDGVGRRSCAPGGQQANAEEMLAELVRLVEASQLAQERPAAPADSVSEPNQTGAEPMQPLEARSLQSSVAASSKPNETGAVDVAPSRIPEYDDSPSTDPKGIDLAGRPSGASTFKVSALVLAAVAVIGAIFWFERVESGPPKATPFIATALAPATAQPRSSLTPATASEAGVTPQRDIAQPAPDKVVSPEEGPMGLNAHVLLNNPPPSADLGPTALGAAQPTADAVAGKPLTAPVNTLPVTQPIAATPPVAPQSLDSKPAPTVSLPPNPTQIATPSPSAANSGVTASAVDAPLPPVRPALKAATETVGVAERSSRKLDLPTKLSSKSAAHVVVAKAEPSGSGVPAETRSEAPRHGAPANSEKGTKTVTAAQAPAEPQAAPSQQPGPAKQPNPNPVVHAFSNVVGALTGLIPFVNH